MTYARITSGVLSLLFVTTARAEEPRWPEGMPPADREVIAAARRDLADRVPAGRAGADAAVFARAAEWALRYENRLSAADVAAVRKMLARAQERAAALAAGRRPWAERAGPVFRGFVSAVDGSPQPYGVIVPAGYDGRRPMRLDVVLHGSQATSGLNELRWAERFDRGDTGAGGPEQDYLELHPLGRVENGYRWAGETDVFEAIAAATREYAVDRDRVVLRGMSMGGSGAWHLGLKHPDRFAALGPYAGYVETERFSRLPYGHFVPVGPLPEYQARGLHMLDSVGYAANLGMVPAVAGVGEKDPVSEQHAILARGADREGLRLVNLVALGRGHELDADSFREQMRYLRPFAAAGVDRAPRRVRFVTWTLKYPRCHWVEVRGLGRHYDRAEVVAAVDAAGNVTVESVTNVSRLAFFPPALAAPGSRLRVAGVDLVLPGARTTPVEVERRGGGWAAAAGPADGKRPGLQGPIDDAFTGPFLCVRGTGRPHHPAVQAWAEARLARFAADWPRYFRGDLPVKDDSAVTPDDLRTKHLVLFGDPGSNRWIAAALPRLKVQWTRQQIAFGRRTFRADRHAPILIQPNPLPGAGERYLVINSGHTFGARELGTLNYLLFPRLGDWAVLDVSTVGGPADGAVAAGFFDESWGVPETAVPPQPVP